MQWLVLTLFLFSLSAFSAPSTSPYIVVIDPGHGGMDTGASLDTLKESELTLKVSQLTRDLFQDHQDIQVFLTRDTDRSLSLHDRSEISKKKRAHLFLSIHANSSPDFSAHGAEFYLPSQMPVDEETLFLANRENNEILQSKSPFSSGDLGAIVEDLQKTQHIYSSQIFAETLLKNWQSKFRTRQQPIKQGPFHVLMNVPTPSVLIEIGFITNARDRKNMKNPKNQELMAEIIHKSILDFKEKIDKAQFSSHIIPHANR